jgi:hypothetical protein
MILAAAVAATPAAAAPTTSATVNATVVKPIVLTWVQDLDLGSITLKPGNWSNATVSISRAGVFSCTNPNTTCAGLSRAAKYNAVGTNNMTATITASNVVMRNQADPTKTLTLMLDKPASITFTNSGQPGITFAIGGSIVLNSTTPEGTYSGTFNVTVEY